MGLTILSNIKLTPCFRDASYSEPGARTLMGQNTGTLHHCTGRQKALEVLMFKTLLCGLKKCNHNKCTMYLDFHVHVRVVKSESTRLARSNFSQTIWQIYLVFLLLHFIFIYLFFFFKFVCFFVFFVAL